jgi:antitoxin component of RelBE/YafQ-DinJ toxin-antitoxin module
MAKSQFIKIRLASEEKQAFQQAADLAGLALSAWIRERLRMVAIRELEGAGYPVPFIQRIPLRTKNDA